jgi:polyisoprenoid-binding protein YceI
MRLLLTTCAAAALFACSPAPKKAAEEPAPEAVALAIPDVPAGDYTLDKTHASLDFKVSHLGFSNYTARFKTFDAALKFDPADPTKASVTATIDPKSLDLPAPPAGFLKDLLGAQWLDAGKYPAITYKSNAVTVTGHDTARIDGELTLHGVTKPVSLNAKFNGGYAGMAQYDPNARIGFSATGVFKRSDFGIAFGVPAPGSTLGVSDEVNVIIETEFTGPPLPPGAAGVAPPAH